MDDRQWLFISNLLGQKILYKPSGEYQSMYDLQYVKKRRRKKIAALVSLFTGIGITSLVIVSFLGRTTGTFSVSIRNSSVRLSLSQKEVCGDKDLTSYLLCDQILKFREFTFTRFNEDGRTIE